MRVSVEFSLDDDDYAQIRDACSAFFFLRGTGATDQRYAQFHELFTFTDAERQCFAPIIGNRFTYQNVSDAHDVICAHHDRLVDRMDVPAALRKDAEKGKLAFESFMRNLWDDIRVHKMGGVLAQMFDDEGEPRRVVAVAI